MSVTEIKTNVVKMNELQELLYAAIEKYGNELTLQETIGCIEVVKHDLIYRSNEQATEY